MLQTGDDGTGERVTAISQWAVDVQPYWPTPWVCWGSQVDERTAGLTTSNPRRPVLAATTKGGYQRALCSRSRPIDWGDQVRGQKGSGPANFGKGTELRFDYDSIPTIPLLKVMVQACRCEKVTRARTNGAETLGFHVHKVISLDVGTRTRWGSLGPNSVGSTIAAPLGVKGTPEGQGI